VSELFSSDENCPNLFVKDKKYLSTALPMVKKYIQAIKDVELGDDKNRLYEMPSYLFFNFLNIKNTKLGYLINEKLQENNNDIVAVYETNHDLFELILDSETKIDYLMDYNDIDIIPDDFKLRRFLFAGIDSEAYSGLLIIKFWLLIIKKNLTSNTGFDNKKWSNVIIDAINYITGDKILLKYYYLENLWFILNRWFCVWYTGYYLLENDYKMEHLPYIKIPELIRRISLFSLLKQLTEYKFVLNLKLLKSISSFSEHNHFFDERINEIKEAFLDYDSDEKINIIPDNIIDDINYSMEQVDYYLNIFLEEKERNINLNDINELQSEILREFDKENCEYNKLTETTTEDELDSENEEYNEELDNEYDEDIDDHYNDDIEYEESNSTIFAVFIVIVAILFITIIFKILF